jgi:hypothetical protein
MLYSEALINVAKLVLAYTDHEEKAIRFFTRDMSSEMLEEMNSILTSAILASEIIIGENGAENVPTTVHEHFLYMQCRTLVELEKYYRQCPVEGK